MTLGALASGGAPELVAPLAGARTAARGAASPVASDRANAARGSGEAVLEFADLSKRYGDVSALDRCTFSVAPGRMVGLLGPNGSGKTTAMRSVFGLVHLDAGEVRWRGRPIRPEERARFGYMPEQRGLYPRMRVRDQVVYFAQLHGLSGAAAGLAADGWLERLGLADRASARVEELSHGNQQRVQLIVALVHEADLLILDEPFAGLDPIGVASLGATGRAARAPARRGLAVRLPPLRAGRGGRGGRRAARARARHASSRRRAPRPREPPGRRSAGTAARADRPRGGCAAPRRGPRPQPPAPGVAPRVPPPLAREPSPAPPHARRRSSARASPGSASARRSSPSARCRRCSTSAPRSSSRRRSRSRSPRSARTRRGSRSRRSSSSAGSTSSSPATTRASASG